MAKQPPLPISPLQLRSSNKQPPLPLNKAPAAPGVLAPAQSLPAEPQARSQPLPQSPAQPLPLTAPMSQAHREVQPSLPMDTSQVLKVPKVTKQEPLPTAVAAPPPPLPRRRRAISPRRPGASVIVIASECREPTSAVLAALGPAERDVEVIFLDDGTPGNAALDVVRAAGRDHRLLVVRRGSRLDPAKALAFAVQQATSHKVVHWSCAPVPVHGVGAWLEVVERASAHSPEVTLL